MAPPSEKKKNIEDAEYFHGFRPKKDAFRLITKPGDFLVRATDSGPSTDLVISAMDENKKLVNITMRVDKEGLWYIAQKGDLSKISHKFPTIVDLVEHYRVHKLSKTLKLLTVVCRPQWMFKHENVVYEQKDKLGSGNFCTVYKGKYTPKVGPAIVVAVKISLVAQTTVDMESEEAKESRNAMMREAQIMSYYTHDNIIQFYGVACDHQPVLVVMEFCAGGDLLSHLIKHGKNTDDREKTVYLYEASRGMFYLHHHKKCVHRDLAARNCLISNSGQVKIADFGLSKVLDSGEKDGDGSGKNNQSNAQVPVRWMAPETLRKDSPPAYSKNSDIWAFGVMAYEVFSNGIKPWPEDPVKYVATQIRKGNMPKMPETTPHKIVNLVSQMWAIEPNKRPSMRTIASGINSMIKDSIATHGAYPPEKMTLNKIPGVERKSFFEHEATSEFEDSNSTVENDSFDKVEKSGGGGGKGRQKPSHGGNKQKRTTSLRDKKSMDK